MKKNNLWHIAWIVGIFATLVAILLLVIEYKVKWEDKDLSTYLYFYKCSDNLCTTTNKKVNHYSKIKCENKECPYIKEINNKYVILSYDEKDYLFDYLKGKVINDSYKSYSFMNDYILVKNDESKNGIINYDGEVIVELKYNKIVDYKDNYLAYSENNKVGIINEELNVDIEPTYEFVQLINDNIYTYREENKYYIASYETELSINNENYDYVYGINNIIIIIKDKKLDITDTNLKSKLVLKIDTFYDYTKEKERESLNIKLDKNLIRFDVDNDENTYTNYIYDTKNNKLFG